MKKRIPKIVLLSILLFSQGWINLEAAPPVVFSSKGPVSVSPIGTMYVKGGMHMFPGATVIQNGLTVLTGDFLHDAQTNVFNTNYSGNVTGVVKFGGNEEQKITTNLEAYTPKAGGATTGKMDRKSMYLKFPDLVVNNGNRVIITPSMGVSVNKLIFTNGKLRLKSDENGGNDQDASLLVEKTAEGYTNDNHMEIERNVIYNRGKVAGTTGFKYFGFSAPIANMYLDYFTDHWVFDQRLEGGVGGYDIRRYQRFDPGVGYFVVVREQSNTTVTNPTDYIRDGLLIQNEHFLFNRTFRDDFFNWTWNAQIPAGDNPKPQEMLSTGDVTIPGGLKIGDNYLGNPYTCALDIDALFTSWGGNVKPTMWIWSGQASNWLVVTKDITTIDMDSKQKVVPSQQMFVVEGVSVVPTFRIPASARTHNAHRFLRSDNTSLKNELLIEVQDAELDNYSRMAVGLRSWGELSGGDESDAKYIKNEDVNIPQVYAVVPHKSISIPYDTLTINSLPEDVRSTNFDFVPAQIDGNRKYIMKISRQESLTTEMAVLVDRKEKIEIDLFENDTYEFYADRFDDTQRFTVLFAPENTTNKEGPSIRTRNAYFQDQTLYVTQNSESDVRKPVEVYNASGLLVYRGQIIQTGTNSYQLNLADGIYIVKSGEMVKKFKK